MLFPFVMVMGVLFFAGCGQPSFSKTVSGQEEPPANLSARLDHAASDAQEKNQFKFFYVYLDSGSRENHFIPSGFMPDGKCLALEERWTDNCHSGKTCIRIDYDLACSEERQRWAGIYWLNPADNWGSRKGGFDLTGAQKITFWARGENGGERIQEFKVGGIVGDYPDTDSAMIGPVILSKEWRAYTIDLRGKDLAYISGGFSWATNVAVNSDECTFYLDEIKYE